MDLRLHHGLALLLAAFVLVLLTSPGAHGQDTDDLECYNFTWPGVNISIPCEEHRLDYLDLEQPCVDTKVYTVPPDSPPNITVLNEVCDNSLDPCPSYKCKGKGKRCISWKWYDITGRLVNYTLFCGNILDQTSPENEKPTRDTCFTTKADTMTKEVCACSSKLCNGDEVGRATGTAATLLMVLLSVLTSMALSPGTRG